MRRLATCAVGAAIVAALVGTGPASAHHSCESSLSFEYCGEHVPASRLPLRVKLSNTGKPGNLYDSGVARAVRDAVDEWNRAWPKAMLTGNGASVQIGPCTPLCYGGTTAATAGVEDGVNAIGWGEPSSCDGSHAERIGVACLWYDGATGAARHRIKEVDIILNQGLSWRLADGDVVLGEIQGSVPVRDFLLVPATWYDVQSVLTHELGHALGLEDIGNSTRRWPADLTDLTKHDQTMYRWYVAGSTNKRTLGAGDIAGLYRVAWDSAND